MKSVDDESTMMTGEAFDAWLREEGYPFLVPPARRRRDLLARSAPGLSAVALHAAGFTVSVPVIEEISQDMQDYDGSVLLLFLLVISALPLVALGVLSQVRRRSRARRRAWTVVASLALLAGLGFSGHNIALHGDGMDSLIAIACVLLGTWSGSWALLGWMLRTTVRQIVSASALSSRALPVILLLVVFTYYTAEIWAFTDTLGLPRLLLFGAVLGGIALLTVLRSTNKEIAEIGQGTLSRSEKRNVRFVLVGAQLSQAVVFAGFLAGILLIIGKITLVPAVVQDWVKHPPRAVVVADIPLPLDTSSIKVAFFFAAVAALNLLVSTSIDTEYNDAYFAPIVARTRIVLARRAEWEASDRDAALMKPSAPGIIRSLERDQDHPDSAHRAPQ